MVEMQEPLRSPTTPTLPLTRSGGKTTWSVPLVLKSNVFSATGSARSSSTAASLSVAHARVSRQSNHRATAAVSVSVCVSASVSVSAIILDRRAHGEHCAAVEGGAPRGRACIEADDA